MKKLNFTYLLLLVVFSYASFASAETFKILDVRNGNATSGVESGSTVESLYNTFGVVFEKSAQKSNVPNIRMVCQETGSTYTANTSRIYPNEYYTDVEGSFGFDFFNGILEAEGTYVVTIAEGTYIAEDGSVNEAYVGTWTIKKAEDFPFDIVKVTNRGYAPDVTLKYLDMNFKVTAENDIAGCDGSKIEVYRGNTALGKMTNWEFNSNGTCTVVFGTWYTGTEDGVDVGSTKTYGTYKVVFSAGAFRDANGYTSKRYECSWKVSSSAVEPEPDEEENHTAIDSTPLDSSHIQSCYDMTGRKINSPKRKGFYIVNGKKVISYL